MAMGDKLINAVTGSNIKTIRVSATQLADLIYVCFVSNPGGSPDSIMNLLKGKLFTYTDIDSPDGKFHFHISYFQRGLTVHRSAWVKNYETQEVFEWKGYTLDPLRTAFRKRANEERVAFFTGTVEKTNTNSFSQSARTPITSVPKRNGRGKIAAILLIVVVMVIYGSYFIDTAKKNKEGHSIQHTFEEGNSLQHTSEETQSSQKNSGLVDDAKSYNSSNFEKGLKPAIEEGEEFIRKNHVKIKVKKYGTITVELYPDKAPITVKNFIELAKEGFYDGLTFHRIIFGFMMQGGDPLGNGTGGAESTIKGEFSQNGVENDIKHVRGTISMARSSVPDSASSQFFILHQDADYLDGQYAAFGQVTNGIEIVDKICANTKVVDNNGTVMSENQPVIEKITVVD